MKKYNSFLYLGLIVLASGISYDASASVGAKTTKDSRGSAMGSIDATTALSGVQGDLSPIALNNLIASAPGNPGVSGPLLVSVKTNLAQLATLMEKLENDITYRDAMLAVLLEDLELVSMILNDPNMSAKYPKTAATLQAATTTTTH